MATHAELVALAERWLKRIGCGVTFAEFVCINGTGEIPDAIGWRSGASIVVEAKTSRSDFLADRKKLVRAAPELGMGDWRFFLCRPGVIRADELPDGWGLLYTDGAAVNRIAGVPKGNAGWGKPPAQGNKRAELALTVSALRRLNIRGLLGKVYEPMPNIRDKARSGEGA